MVQGEPQTGASHNLLKCAQRPISPISSPDLRRRDWVAGREAWWRLPIGEFRFLVGEWGLTEWAQTEGAMNRHAGKGLQEGEDCEHVLEGEG